MDWKTIAIAGLLVESASVFGQLAIDSSHVDEVAGDPIPDQVRVRALGLLSGPIASLVPALPPPPTLPIPLPDFSLRPLPDGIIPNFSLELPLPAVLQNLALPPLPIPPNPERNTIGNCGQDADLRQRAVFMELNLQPNNQVLAFARRPDGSLCEAGVFNTAGGSDYLGPLESGQDEIIATDDYLFVTNSGSLAGPLGNGSISVFRIEQDRLLLTDNVSSEGPNPRSITRHGDLIYVVNAGLGLGLLGPNLSLIPETMQGFRFDEATGQLHALTGSQLRTIDPHGEPAQIGFSPDANHLVISQRRHTFAVGTGAEPANIEIVTLNEQGLPVRIHQQDVKADHPFGFRFDDEGRLYLTHGGFIFPNAGAVSSYQLSTDGVATVLTPPTPDPGTATCWNYITRTTAIPYMYTSAAIDSSVAQWQINPDGTLFLVNAQAASASVTDDTQVFFDGGGFDMDGVIESQTGQEYLYLLNVPFDGALPVGLRVSRIVGLKVMPDGSLVKIGKALAQGIPNTGFGMSAR